MNSSFFFTHALYHEQGKDAVKIKQEKQPVGVLPTGCFYVAIKYYKVN